MANTFLNISMITNEALDVLVNHLAFTRGVNRQYNDSFAKSGAKIGDTLNVRKPARYTVANGSALALQDATETSIPVVLTTQAQVAITFTTADLLLRIDDFSNRFIKPAVAAIANQIDADGLAMATAATYNSVGTPGTPIVSLLPYLTAGAKLDDNATPRGDGFRNMILNPISEANIIDGLKGIFNPGNAVSEQNASASMRKAYGFNWDMDQNVSYHTTGPLGGVPLVNATAGQTGNTLVTTGWTAAAASRLNKADVFTIAGVYSVNPQSRQTTGNLQQFVTTSGFSSDASGNGSISFSPAITPTGAFQNVTNAPAAGAAITVLGGAGIVSAQNLAYHKDAFTLVTADLPLPGGVDMAARKSDPQTGISLRMVRAYDVNTDKLPCRIEVLYGWAPLYPEWACRVAV